MKCVVIALLVVTIHGNLPRMAMLFVLYVQKEMGKKKIKNSINGLTRKIRKTFLYINILKKRLKNYLLKFQFPLTCQD